MNRPDLADLADPGRVARVALALAVLAVLAFLGRAYLHGGDRLEVRADFNRAGLNIRAGDEVRIRGIPVGRIDRIEVDDRDLSARYVLSLDPGTRVATDSTARVVPKTLLGDKFVELDPAPAHGEVLADGALIDDERTETVAELEQVLDHIGTAFGDIDAAALGGALSAISYGLGDAVALRGATAGFAGLSEGVVDAEDDVDRLLGAFPDVADTLSARAGDVETLMTGTATIAGVLERRAEDVATALRANAEFVTRTADLVSDPRFLRTIAGGLDVLDIILAHPGAVQQYLQGVPVYLQGLVDAVFMDHLYAKVSHLLAVLPFVDSHGGDDVGGRGPGPDIVIHTPPPDEMVPVPSGGGGP